MATKTISIDLVAYEKLTAARREPRDSFSQIIRRATWEAPRKTCSSLLDSLPDLPPAEEAVIRDLQAAQSEDLPTEDSWL
ncbi:MAG: hypothetical protein NWT08_08685 [Akkermansiaceae bacterium]|jgi:predicted CopG family antitoxin|nr:hypothetical protein [Akkermansiaceae bacterium]MDP4648020.1 hypothetical protein [Akkermansiaceae bacterium]MDP4720327.1 hypothetical protein [Akkermansiaceae bacterium]MDP4781368.1 hypothetical protein [Akkermansiaceae bacterium]MDP4848687.1 hypothetical protein [Akkermansiaceae bacterium]